MRAMIVTIATLAIISLSGSPGFAKPTPAPAAAKCRDAKGHFTPCPATPAVAAAPAGPAKCRDAKGHFTPCVAAPVAAVKPPVKPAPVAVAHAAPAAAPGAATAKCKDGSLSMSKQHSGACSHHGGVASWM